MGVNIVMTGTGSVGDIQPGWSVQEDASPVAADDTSGSTGLINVQTTPSAQGNTGTLSSAKFIIDNNADFIVDNIDLEPGAAALGTISGYIDNVNINDTTVEFDILPNLTLLSTDVTAPAVGLTNLSQIFALYVALATPRLSVNYIASVDPVRTFIGWEGDLWTKLKELCAVERVEISLTVDGFLTVRDVGSRVLTTVTDPSGVELGISNEATGRNIEVVSQNTTYVASVVGNSIFNYSQNPSLETNATNWTSAPTGASLGTYGGGTATVTSSGRSSALAYKGANAYRVVMTEDVNHPANPATNTRWGHVATAYVQHTIDISSLPALSTFSASMAYKCVYTTKQGTGSQVGVTSLDDDGVLELAFWNGTTFISNVFSAPVSPSAWNTATISNVVAPTGATKITLTMRGGVEYVSWSSSVATGQTMYVDAAMLTIGAPVSYFDGTSPGGSWAGTANNSTSILTVTGTAAFYDAYQDNNTIYSVNAGETNTTQIGTTNYPISLTQPVQSVVAPIPVGNYYVSDGANLPISIASWQQYGGSVTVSNGTTPGTIMLTMVGPKTDIPGSTGPYSLQYYDGANQYAALSIAGVGVISAPTTLKVATGANPDTTTNDVASTIDSPFVGSISKAYDVAHWPAVYASGPVSTITFTIPTAKLPGFGLTAGSVFSTADAWYRITSVNIGKTATSITAIWYTTIARSTTAGQTIAQHNAIWAGATIGDHKIMPLRSAF